MPLCKSTHSFPFWVECLDPKLFPPRGLRYKGLFCHQGSAVGLRNPSLTWSWCANSSNLVDSGKWRELQSGKSNEEKQKKKQKKIKEMLGRLTKLRVHGLSFIQARPKTGSFSNLPGCCLDCLLWRDFACWLLFFLHTVGKMDVDGQTLRIEQHWEKSH